MMAAQRALDSLDLVRGIWNLFLTPAFRLTLKGAGGPLNRILLGPIRTIHHRDGSPASPVYWFDPSWSTPVKPISIGSKISQLKSFEQDIRHRLKGHPYRKNLEIAIRRYARALDHRDHHLSVTELWALLEYLTGTTKARYDDTIRRTAFVFRLADRQKIHLEHLRRWRNRIVHSAQGSSHAELLAQQCKHSVEALLRFHLFVKHGCGSLHEAGNLLAMTTDTAAVVAMERRARFVRGYRGR